jgi:hypothetical protein
LVCHSWRAAAALASPEIELKEVDTQQQADALCAWLLTHGSAALRHFSVESSRHRQLVTFSMPWQQFVKLQSLRLKAVALPALAAAAHAPPFAALTALTSLRLTCQNIQSYALARQLRLLTGLCCLKLFPLGNLDGAGVCATSPAAAAGFREALTGVLLQLVQLTSLSLRHTGMDGTALAAVSRLSQLQRLHLTDECRRFDEVTGEEVRAPLHMQHLPSSLTQLKIMDSAVSCSGSGPNSRGQQLQQLQELKLRFVHGFQLEIVAHMTSLTHVSIQDALSAEGLTNLLDGLSHLQQLQRLSVDADGDRRQFPPAASYAALTASSQLTALLLTNCSMHRDAAQHMFAAGRRMPQLQQLAIAPCDWTLHDFSGMLHDVRTLEGYSLILQRGSAARLVACCHNLRSLSLLWATPQVYAASLLPLTTLTRLTSLRVGGDGWGIVATGAVLSRLTGNG